MSEIITTKAYFVKMVGAAICGQPIPACPQDVNKKQLYKLAVNNAVQNILYLAVSSGKVTFPEEITSRLKNTYLFELMREASQREEIDFIRQKFNELNFNFMFLKGPHLKPLYPASEMRFMVDMDVLVLEKDLEACKSIMLERGFKLKINSSKDIVLIKEPCLTIELHKMLFVEDYFMHSYFIDVWKRAEKSENCEHKMTFNDLYVYTLAHLAEHYLSAGSCFRPIMDLFLIERKHAEELDFVYINKQFEILGIKKFAENIRKLYGCMFSEGNYTEELSIMENYIVLGPPIKNAATVSNAMTTQKSKPRMIFETIFPSLSHMKLKYPILEKHPILLPIFWVIRLFQYLFTKDTRITKKRKELITYDEENISVMEEILKKSGF